MLIRNQFIAQPYQRCNVQFCMTCHCTLSLLPLAPLYCTISLNCAPTLLQSLCCQGCYSCGKHSHIRPNQELELVLVCGGVSFFFLSGFGSSSVGGWGCSRRDYRHVAPVGSRDRCSFPGRWCNSPFRRIQVYSHIIFCGLGFYDCDLVSWGL